jgi:GAF domain-containing protein
VPRIALDIGDDAVYFKNPDLPDTHSEMALPLKSGNEVIGVLDVQSTVPNAFNQEDIEILSTLVAQVSIAIQNARLFETTQKSLADAEISNRQFIQKEWAKVSQKQAVTGFRYNILGTAAIDGVDSATVERVTSQKVYIDNSNEISTLAVPITLRGEVIGILDMQSPGSRSWDQDEIDIAQAIADRVAIAAENARLFDETTSRAERERTVSDITSKIRSTNDPNEMIQIALNELKQVLKVKDARVVPYNPQKSNGES